MTLTPEQRAAIIREDYDDPVLDGGTSADPHDNPHTRWESGPDGEFTRVMLYGEKPKWLRDDDVVKFWRDGGWRDADGWPTGNWGQYPAFFLRRRPQAPALDEGLVALIEATMMRTSTQIFRKDAEAVARALVAAGWRKEEA